MSCRMLSVLNISFLTTSLILIILSGINFYFIVHAMNTLAYWFNAGSYAWLGPYGGGKQWVRNHVTLKYDYSNENVELVATSFSLVAGLLGVLGFWATRKNQKLLSTPLTTTLLLAPSSLTLLLSLTGIIYTSVHNDAISHSTCDFWDGYIDGHIFTCTREVAACNIIKSITDTNWADNNRICREAKAGRLMLAGIVVISALSFAAGVGRWWLRRTAKESADERVGRLTRDEE